MFDIKDGGKRHHKNKLQNHKERKKIPHGYYGVPVPFSPHFTPYHHHGPYPYGNVPFEDGFEHVDHQLGGCHYQSYNGFSEHEFF